MSRRRKQNKQQPPPVTSRPSSWTLWLGILVLAVVVAWCGRLAIRHFTQPRPGVSGTSGGASAAPVVWNDNPLLPEVSLDATPHEMADEAQQVLDQLLAAFPENPNAHGVVGDIYSLFGRSAEAVAAWKKSLQLDPEFAEGFRRLGSQRMEDGDYKESARLLAKAYALDKRFPGIANQLADALLHDGQMQQAREILLDSLTSGTSTNGVHFLLGQVALQTRDFSAAYRELTLALEADPNNTNACFGLATACGRLGKREEAVAWRKKFQSLKAAETAEGIDSMRNRADTTRVRGYLAAAYREAGNIYRRQQRLAEAELHWLRSAAWAPGDIAIRRTLVFFYREQQDLVKLAKIHRQLTEIEPSNPTHVLELGRVLRDAGRLEAAEEQLTHFCKLAPDRDEGYSALALLYADRPTEHGKAIEFALRAVELNATAANYFVLGVVSQANGDLPAALDAVRQATELEPQHAGYRNAYDALRASL